MSNIELYCRKNREKSISPCISLENSVNLILTDDEKLQKTYYNATSHEMAKEFYMSLDDIYKNINYFLNKKAILICKSQPEFKVNKACENFYEKIYKTFIDTFDEGEHRVKIILGIKIYHSRLNLF